MTHGAPRRRGQGQAAPARGSHGDVYPVTGPRPRQGASRRAWPLERGVARSSRQLQEAVVLKPTIDTDGGVVLKGNDGGAQTSEYSAKDHGQQDLAFL